MIQPVGALIQKSARQRTTDPKIKNLESVELGPLKCPYQKR